MLRKSKTSYQVKVSARGTIALPKKLRVRNKIQESDILTLVSLGDGVVIMHQQKARVDEIADQLAKEWENAGLSLEEMLTTLRDVRAEHAT